MNDDSEDRNNDEEQITDEDFALYHRGYKQFWERPTERTVEWLYENYIPRGSLVVLVGESGIGKSVLAMDLSVAVANADSFAGYDYASSVLDLDDSDDSPAYTVKPSYVLYLHGEGDASQVVRFTAAHETRKSAYQHADAPSSDDPNSSRLPIFRKELMSADEGHDSFHAHIKRMKSSKDYQTIVKATRLSYGLIVVDTLIAVGGLSDENNSVDMQRCINRLRELGREFKATVLVIVHPKKGSHEIRGSSALFNAADVVLRIEKKPQAAGVLRLVQDKARHGPKQPPKDFRLVPFAGDPSTVGGGIMPPVIEWLDEDERIQPQVGARTRRNGNARVIVPREHVENDSDVSGFKIYMEAARLAVMGHGKTDMAGFMWATLDAIREWFDRAYQRNAEATRKAFERAHKRAMGEGKVVVSTVDSGRQLVRVVE